MASIADRWHVTVRGSSERVKSPRYGTGKRWQVRYRDPDGASRNRSFDRKADAERFLVDVQHRLNRGSYVDERGGRVLFAEVASEWMARQVMAPSTREAMELRLRVHLLPAWGTWQVGHIRAADVQKWLRCLSDTCAPNYVRLLWTNFAAMLQSATDDGLIPQNPARSRAVKVPSRAATVLRPWDAARVESVIQAAQPDVQALVAAAAGCGLRQGEAFGLRVHDVDFERAELHVRQQIRLEAGKPVPALPKYQRVRSVPAPGWVLDAMRTHMTRTGTTQGRGGTLPSLEGLLFVTREGKPWNRNYFNPAVWHPLLEKLGIPRERENGMHALRHACASIWLEHGVSIKAVSEYLGHADPGFTLRTYTHVMPSSGDKARQALDAALGKGRRPDAATSSAGAPWAHETTHEDGN